MLIEKSGLSTRFNIRLGMDKKNLSPLMPKDAPMSLQTLIRWCWSDQPQNRPKDLTIITQLDNLACELAELTDEEWSNKKKHWKNPCSQSGSPASTIISESDHGVMSHDSKASATFPNFQLPQFSNEEMTMTVLEALTQLTKEVKSIRQNQENLANEVEHLRRQFEGARQIFHRRQPSVASKTTTSGFQSRQSLLASPEKETSRHRNSLCTCRNCGHLFYGGSNQCLKDGPNASKSLTAVHELVHELEDRSTSVPFELTSIVQSNTASNESDEIINDLIDKNFH
uniref:Serine-threonine/tyrosine-protein kinase catalytic domain-containing protein n=1 Tax=Acrobeloides nanus TaxID=290746 RepID=A0A914EHU4_9BILA